MLLRDSTDTVESLLFYCFIVLENIFDICRASGNACQSPGKQEMDHEDCVCACASM